MPDGALLGIGTDNRLWRKADLASAWTKIPNHASQPNLGMKAVAIMRDGAVLAVGPDNFLYTKAKLDSAWVKAPGTCCVTDVTVRRDGTIVGIATASAADSIVARASLAPGPWLGPYPGSCCVTSIQAMPDGSFIGSGTDKLMYRRGDLGGAWTQVPNSSAVIGLTSLKDDTIVGIGTDLNLYTWPKVRLQPRLVSPQPPPAAAELQKQCIKNIFGTMIVADVTWYRPKEVHYNDKTKEVTYGTAHQREKIAVLQYSCVLSHERMHAVVRVVGGDIAKGAAQAAVSFAVGTVMTIGAGVACVGTAAATAGGGIPACAGYTAWAVKAGSTLTGALVSKAVPDAKEIFYSGSPGMVEIWGTAFDPQAKETRAWGTGRRVNQSCNANADCYNNACGRPEAGADAKVCCPSADFRTYAGHDYCNGLPAGKRCWADSHCANVCRGNMGGLQKGRCD